jgi:hypothetical protein
MWMVGSQNEPTLRGIVIYLGGGFTPLAKIARPQRTRVMKGAQFANPNPPRTLLGIASP